MLMPSDGISDEFLFTEDKLDGANLLFLLCCDIFLMDLEPFVLESFPLVAYRSQGVSSSLLLTLI